MIVYGVITQMGLHFMRETVVLTAGTFLAGKIHIGIAIIIKVDVQVIRQQYIGCNDYVNYLYELVD